MAMAAKANLEVEKESETAEERSKGDENGADISEFSRRLRELVVEHKKMLPFSRAVMENIMQTVCSEENEIQLNSETRPEGSLRKNVEGVLLGMEYMVSTTLKQELEETRKDWDETKTKLILAEENKAIITKQHQEKIARLQQKVAELEVTNSGLASDVENKSKELQTCSTRLTKAEESASKLEQDKNRLTNDNQENIFASWGHVQAKSGKQNGGKLFLRTENARLTIKTSQLEGQIKKLVETENNCEKQLSNLKQALEEKDKEADEQRERLSEANKQLLELKQTMDEKLQEADKEKTRLFQDNEKQLSKLQQADKQLSALQQTMEEKLQEADKEKTRLSEANKQLLELQGTMDKKLQEADKEKTRLLQANEKQLSKLQQALDGKQKEVDGQQGRLREANKKLSEVQKTMDEKLQEADKEKTRLLQVNSQQMSKLQQALEEKQKEIEGQQKRLSEANKQLLELQQTMDEKLQEADKEKTRILCSSEIDLQKMEKGLTEEKEKLKAKQKLLQQNISSNEKELQKKEKELIEEKKNREKKHKLLQQKLRETNKQLSELQQTINEKLQEADKEKTRYENELLQKEKELKKKKMQGDTEHQKLLEQVGSQEKQLSKMKQALEEKQKEMDNEKTRIAQLESELCTTKTDLKKEGQKLRETLQEKEHTLSILSKKENELKGVCKELKHYKLRLASLNEKCAKQVQEKHVFGKQSEVKKDFFEFCDGKRIDAIERIQSLCKLEDEFANRVYYPRLACLIFETAYELVNETRNAVFDLFKQFSKTLVELAPSMGQQHSAARKEGKKSSWTQNMKVAHWNSVSEYPTDVHDGLMLSLKENAHICILECLEDDVRSAVLEKWNARFASEPSKFMPPVSLVSNLRDYIRACIRLAWRMVTQIPPMKLEYQSYYLNDFHKKMGYYTSSEVQTMEEGQDPVEEIACYLWPCLLDGKGQLIRAGEVLCKTKKGAQTSRV